MKLQTLALLFLATVNAESKCGTAGCTPCIEDEKAQYTVYYNSVGSTTAIDTGFHQSETKCLIKCSVLDSSYNDAAYDSSEYMPPVEITPINGVQNQLGFLEVSSSYQSGYSAVSIKVKCSDPNGIIDKIKEITIVGAKKGEVKPKEEEKPVEKCDEAYLNEGVLTDITLQNYGSSKEINLGTWFTDGTDDCALDKGCEIFVDGKAVAGDFTTSSKYEFKSDPTNEQGYTSSAYVQCSGAASSLRSKSFTVTQRGLCEDFWTVDETSVSKELSYAGALFEAKFPVYHESPDKCPITVQRATEAALLKPGEVSAVNFVQYQPFVAAKDGVAETKAVEAKYTIKSDVIAGVTGGYLKFLISNGDKKWEFTVGYTQEQHPCVGSLTSKRGPHAKLVADFDSSKANPDYAQISDDVVAGYFDIDLTLAGICKVSECRLFKYNVARGVCDQSGVPDNLAIGKAKDGKVALTASRGVEQGVQENFCIKCMIGDFDDSTAVKVQYEQNSMCKSTANFKVKDASKPLKITTPIKQEFGAVQQPLLVDASTLFYQDQKCPITSCQAYTTESNCETQFDSALYLRDNTKFYLDTNSFNGGMGSNDEKVCIKCNSGGNLGGEAQAEVHFMADSVCKDSVLPIMEQVKKSYSPKKYQMQSDKKTFVMKNNKKIEILQTVTQAVVYKDIVEIQNKEATDLKVLGKPMTLMAKKNRFENALSFQDKTFKALCKPSCELLMVGCMGDLGSDDLQYLPTTGLVYGNVISDKLEVKFCMKCKQGKLFDSPTFEKDNMRYSIIDGTLLLIIIIIVVVVVVLGGGGAAAKANSNKNSNVDENAPVDGAPAGAEMTNQVGQEGAETGRGMVDENGNPIEGEVPVEDLEKAGDQVAEAEQDVVDHEGVQAEVVDEAEEEEEQPEEVEEDEEEEEQPEEVDEDED